MGLGTVRALAASDRNPTYCRQQKREIIGLQTWTVRGWEWLDSGSQKWVVTGPVCCHVSCPSRASGFPAPLVVRHSLLLSVQCLAFLGAAVCLTVALICISLTTFETEHFPISSLNMRVLLCEVGLSVLCLHFQGFASCSLIYRRPFHILDRSPLLLERHPSVTRLVTRSLLPVSGISP